MRSVKSDILTEKWIDFRYELPVYRPKDETDDGFIISCENLKNYYLSYRISRFTQDIIIMKAIW